MLGEHIDRRTIAALALAVVGFAFMSGNAIEASGAVGLALSLLAMVTFVALVLVNKPLADTYGGIRAAQIQMTGAGVLIAPIVLFTVHFPSPTTVVALAGGARRRAHGLGDRRVSQLLVGRRRHDHRRARLPRAGDGGAVGLAVLNESPATATLIGGTAILVAGLLVVKNQRAELEVAGVTG